MRIAINHITRYRFEEQQERIIQALRMRPADTDHQTVVAWRFDVDCDARLKRHEDGFGNEVTMIYINGPVDTVELVVSGEVLTDPQTGGVVEGASEPLPPALFLRSSSRTAATPEMTSFARQFVEPRKKSIEDLHRLNVALGEKLKKIPGKPEDIRPAGEAFAAGEATVREMAGILVGIARSVDIPARFVSGYRANNKAEPEASLHAWAEIYIENLGWTGFDPSFGISPNECYVRVATGVDDSDTWPVSGSRAGSGEEELEVEVLVGAAQA